MPTKLHILPALLVSFSAMVAGASLASATSIVQPPPSGQSRMEPRPELLPKRNQAYHNGYRGYREPRAGYRYREGFWFPPSAFASGAANNDAALPSRPVGAHYDWCRQRYRTYRLADDSYVPSAGLRRKCVSPYR